MLTWAIVYAIVNAFIPPWYLLAGIVGDVLLGLFAVSTVTTIAKQRQSEIPDSQLVEGFFGSQEQRVN